MLSWIKHFLLLPLWAIASVCTALFFAVQILMLTTWKLILNAREASHSFMDAIRPRKKSVWENPYVWSAVVAVAIVGVVVYQKRKVRIV